MFCEELEEGLVDPGLVVDLDGKAESVAGQLGEEGFEAFEEFVFGDASAFGEVGELEE